MHRINTTIKIIFLSLLITLAACQKASDHNTLKVGTIAGPETELMAVAQQVAEKKYGLQVRIVPFTDYSMPNEALADGSIDVNVFQTPSYLQEAILKRGYNLVSVGSTFIYPMGIYSKKISKLQQLPAGATIAIPNDPSNSARALLLLQFAGLISLKEGGAAASQIADIIHNAKHLKFKEIDASQLPRALPDVDLAVINTNYVMLAGLLPSRDALLIENASAPYANLIVVRHGSENDPRVKQLLDALHSPEVVARADALFKGQAIAAWK